MLRIVTSLALLCAFVGGATAQTAARLPRVDYRERTLANGLRVLSVEDHSSPTVAIHVWYHVGAKDDPQGNSGFAHLFEHLMFKSTKNMKDEMMDRLTEDVGGMNNAFTAPDVTVYHEIVPSNYLETLLWAEADRLASLNVTETNFPSERDVVKEEYRQRILAPPYGRLRVFTEDHSWAAHPYKRPGIGNIEELDASSLETVRNFHKTYYRPDNATLVVVGDFDPKQFDAWVDKYFAGVPKPAAPLPRVTIKEPARTGEKRYEAYAPNVPLPAITFTYLVPSMTHDDAYPLRVAEAILAGGESSRLYQSLVYQQEVAADVSAGTDLREDAGLFIARAFVASGKEVADAEKSLSAEIDRMKTAPVTAAELDKAKTQVVAGKLREFETNDGKASALGEAAVLYGDPKRVNTDLERLMAVTAADIQRVMQKYFTNENRVVVLYQDESRKGAQKGGEAK
jgi:zinc protease